MVQGEPTSSEVAFVLFADLVGYSLLPLEQQVGVVAEFKAVGREVADTFNCPLALDSGDAIALVFFGAPTHSAECAEAFGEKLRTLGIAARSGLHCGPVTRVNDVNGRPNAVGPAINIAERAMSCGDAGHILVSSAAAEMLLPFEKWRTLLSDLGDAEVKHGVEIHVYNLVTESAGNPEIPGRIANRSKPQKRNNFTEPDRPFVGRRHELESLGQRLEDGQARLLTLSGPGGIGKTRLALEAAKVAEPNYVDGAWVIECDSVKTGEDLVAQISNTLSAPSDANPFDALKDFLSDKQILLVIDCFERLVAHSSILDELLRHAPELQMLVTSRTLLGLSRESEVVVSPLSLKRETGATADAISLFVNAAAAVDPDFRITRKNHEVIESVVQSVEGIPLAIILAAGRLRHLSLSELHEQLANRKLDILRRRVAAEDRHANLERVVEDSFGLLRPELKELLVSLSVFRGFHIKDANLVLADVASLLDGVSELRENSLLAAQVVDDQMRYRSLDVVAEYIDKITDSSFLEPLRKRHAEHFARCSSALRELYEDGRWKEANSGLSAELGNYRRAIDYAILKREATLVQPLSRSLGRILMEGGYRSDFEKLAKASLELAAEEGDLPLLIENCGLLAAVLKRDKKYGEAEQLWIRKAYYAREMDDPNKEADTWLDLATMAVEACDLSRAETCLRRYDELAQRVTDPILQASGQATKALVAVQMGQRGEAERCAAVGEKLAEKLPLTLHTLGILTVLAETYNELDMPKESERICVRGIKAALQTKGLTFGAHLLLKLAASLDLQGRQEAASALAIVQLVPKSLSPTLRERTKVFRETFVKSRGSELLKTCEKSLSGLDWQLEALDLIEGMEGNAWLFPT